jgi:hypothetical protein
MNFPDDITNIIRSASIPFSKRHFQLVIDKFGLPRATPWLCSTSSPHFQRYCLEVTESSFPRTGNVTPKTDVSKRTTSIQRDHNEADQPRRSCDRPRPVPILLSFNGADICPSPCHSELQAAFIQQQIKELAQLAS